MNLNRTIMLMVLGLLCAAARLPAAPLGGMSPRDIVGMAITENTGHTYAWYRDGTVSSGTSSDLSRHRRRYRYILPRGYTPDDIVGIVCRVGLASNKPLTYAFYRNGKFSVGVSNNLAKYFAPARYRLPSGKRPADIVGMSHSKSTGPKSKGSAYFAWYRDGTVSAGYLARDLCTFRKPYRYVMPSGKRPRDIVGMGCAPDSRHHFAWYSDGTVSSGVSDHLDRHRKRYSYRLP
jgi:hypothetical protein